MQLIDQIKLNIIFFLNDDKIFASFGNYAYYKEHIASDPELYISFKSGCSQILNNKGFSQEHPINDISVSGLYAILKMLELNYKRLKSDYKGLKNKFIIDKFEISNSKESIILYHKVYTTDVNLNMLNSNIKKIDKSKNRFKYGEVVVVASRPSMGVTSLLVQLGMEFSKFHNINYLTNNTLNESLKSEIHRYAANFNNNMINSTISIVELKLTTKDIKQCLSNIYNSVVIIDNIEVYEKLMSTKFLQNISQINKLLIILGSKLKRSVEIKNNCIPTCEDLPMTKFKQSFIDKIILLRRPYYYNVAADCRDISLYLHNGKVKQIFNLKLLENSFQKIETN